MLYYIFKVQWSQTDSEMRIVQAPSREQAEAFLKGQGEHGPRFVNYYGVVDSITKIK
jgi:hypothetical protein